MARDLSEEELQLKKRARRRLVGAIVLVAVVAVILPMVLDSEPRPVTQNVEIQIPSPNEAAPASPKAAMTTAQPATPLPAAAPADAAQTGKSAETPPAAPAGAKPDAAPGEPLPANPVAGTDKAVKAVEPSAASKAPASVPKPAPAAEASKASRPDSKAPTKKADTPAATKKPDAVVAEGKAAPATPAKDAGAQSFVVQLAALADAAKAKQLQQQVAGAGIKAYTEVLQTAKGPVTRVRAGPFASREAADKARERLKSAGLEGKVVPK